MSERNASDPTAQAARGKLGGAARAAQLKGTAKLNTYLKENNQHVHRVVAALALDRPLEPDEVVHHEDENKHNNDPINLIVFPHQSWHARHHKLNHCGLESCDCHGIRLKEVMPNANPS